MDLSEIEAIGDSDQILKQLAIAAVSDPEPEMREEAVDTMGNFGEKKVLGVLAADELIPQKFINFFIP